MVRPSRPWLAALAGAAFFAILPASADIKAFNAKVTAKDFKAAAAEAIATWPTLDKSRKDLSIIAREFGFAAYMAGDYAAARAFAEYALANEPAGPVAEEQRATSAVLVNLAAHRLQQTPATRLELFNALTARAAMPGIDIITYLGLDATLAYDFEKGKWQDAQASSTLAERLTATGGPDYLLHNRRFQLFNSVAAYMFSKDKSAFDKLDVLVEVMKSDIEAARTEDDAAAVAAFYWEVSAWRQTIGSHLVGRKKMKWPERSKEESKAPTPRQVKFLDAREDEQACNAKPNFKKLPEYPSAALYRGLIGTVILAADVDEAGRASNPKILAAVPDKFFGDAVLRAVKDMRYLPGDRWGAGCSLSQKGRVTVFQFAIR